MSIVQYIHKHNLLPKKSFGQNFLITEGIYDSILQAAELDPSDCVIEVGPGLGTLTQKLAERSKQIIAIEKDTSLRSHIEIFTQGCTNIQLVEEDVLQVRLDNIISGPYKVIANIPYYITSPIIFKFLKHTTAPTLLVLLMQKEVAKRIITQGKGSSVISILVQAYGTPEIIRDVHPQSFYPAPNVTSSILRIRPYTTPRIQSQSIHFERMVKIGFSQKRKMLAHNLHSAFHISKELSRQIIEACGIANNIRAERLTIEEWDTLTKRCLPLLEEQRQGITYDEE